FGLHPNQVLDLSHNQLPHLDLNSIHPANYIFPVSYRFCCFVKNTIMKYTEEQMRETIKEWQVSGLSKKAFCRERGIVYQTFHNWFNRINKNRSSGFTEIALPPRKSGESCEIIFPSGVRMIFDCE